MELELQAHPDTVAALSALKALPRDGRARSQAVKTIWHDSAGHDLLRQGLTLAQRQGIWTLERLLPAQDTWLPGQPPPVLAQADQPQGLDVVLPEPLAPVVAFEGRRTVSLHRVAEIPVSVTLERGILRSVTAERPIARIGVRGEASAVRAAALLIMAAVPARVPCASLAAEAIALATGTGLAARHLGQPVLPHADMTIADALAHILGHLTDVILHYAPAAAAPDDEPPRIEAVHQMRVAVRRALSAVSVFRAALPAGTLDPVRDSLKVLGRQLAATRDWDVFVSETAVSIDHVLPGDEKLERMIAAAMRRRREHRLALSAFLNSPAFRTLGLDLAWFAASHTWHPPGHPDPPDAGDAPPEGTEPPNAVPPDVKPVLLADFAAHVLRHRWKKLISAGKRIETLDTPALHGVRLRAKRARYAAEMFLRPDAGKAAHRFIRRLSLLQQKLGQLNDGAVAAQLMRELGGASGRHGYAVGVVTGFTAAGAGKIRPKIMKAYEKVRRLPQHWS
jgi:CHAD domain-containing protein